MITPDRSDNPVELDRAKVGAVSNSYQIIKFSDALLSFICWAYIFYLTNLYIQDPDKALLNFIYFRKFFSYVLLGLVPFFAFLRGYYRRAVSILVKAYILILFSYSLAEIFASLVDKFL